MPCQNSKVNLARSDGQRDGSLEVSALPRPAAVWTARSVSGGPPILKDGRRKRGGAVMVRLSANVVYSTLPPEIDVALTLTGGDPNDLTPRLIAGRFRLGTILAHWRMRPQVSQLF